MFEDSLIESGGRLKTKRGATTFISFLFQVMLIGFAGVDPAIVHRSFAKNPVNDLPGGPAAAPTSASASGCGSHQGG